MRLADAEIKVRAVAASDEASWRSLWDGYCRFYEVELAPDVTRHTWNRLMDPGSPVNAIVAEQRELGVIGLANYVVHENTWETAPVCYLEDLFVDRGVRASGVGRKLIDWLVDAMARDGWSRLYWVTGENNYRARGLYDKYTPRDAFVRYVVKRRA